MKLRLFIISLLSVVDIGLPILAQEQDRFLSLQMTLDSLSIHDATLLEPIDISVTNFQITDLLKTVAIGNNLNVNLDLDKYRHQITCNLEQVPLKEILLLCCREGNLDLTVDRAGIITIRPWQAMAPIPPLSVSRDTSGLYSMDFSDCPMDALVRRLIIETGCNIVYEPSLSSRTLSGFGTEMSLPQMMDNISMSNGLKCELAESGFWMIGEKGRGGNSFFPDATSITPQPVFCVRRFPMRFRTIDDVVEIIPTVLKKGIEIKLFSDLNSLVISGNQTDVEALEDFLNSIDESVPLISIDVMIVDATNKKSRSTGISFGKGDQASGNSYGTLSPGVDVSLGAGKINQLLNAFNGLGLVNLGNVGPNFYANLKLLEEDGAITLRSTPKLSTLNGHKAVLKSGEVKYYRESQVNIIGTQNPLQSESYLWKNVEASFILDMTPIVSADSTITIRIELSQDEFTERDSGDLTAPPGMTKRSFNSIVKVKDGEMILLGGIEKNLTDDSSTGLPWIARVPVLRLFFGNVTKTRAVQKLNVFIRPTIIS